MFSFLRQSARHLKEQQLITLKAPTSSLFPLGSLLNFQNTCQKRYFSSQQQKPSGGSDENYREFADLSKIDKRAFSNLSRDEQIAKIDEALKQQEKKEADIEDDQSFDRPGTSSIYIFLVGSLGLLVGYLVMQVNTMRHQKKSGGVVNPQSIRTNVSGQALIGGDWELKDTKGRQFGSQDLVGTYYLIYFGFCNCPDICPNSLIKLVKGLQKVRASPEGRFMKIKTIFVSVDPDRDTNANIDAFLNIFDPSIVGVTGTDNNDPNLREMMKKFRIYSTKMEFEETQKEGYVQEESQGKAKKPKKNYTIDHTVLTYLMDDQNNYLAHLGSNLSENDLAKIITENILANERDKMKRLA